MARVKYLVSLACFYVTEVASAAAGIACLVVLSSIGIFAFAVGGVLVTGGFIIEELRYLVELLRGR